MNNVSFVRKLNRLGACDEAIEWVKSHGGTSAECWQDCERGDWMAWLAAETVTRRQLVGALADCAALSLKYFEAEYPDDKRVRECINTCRKYAAGTATDKELADAAAYAASAAHASAYAAYAASAAHAAYAAAHAAYAAASAAAHAAARSKTLKKCANIFRKHFPNLVED